MKSVFVKRSLLSIALAFISTVTLSQSGPGGFEDTSGTSELVLWLQADVGVLNSGASAASNGEGVATWQDQSGYGYDAVTAATSPIYTTSGIGGMPSITFAGGATEFLFVEDDADEAPQLDGTSEISIFYVYEQSTVAGLNAHISKRDGNGVQQSYLAYENGGQNSRVNGNNDPGQTIAAATSYINAITYQNGDFDHFLNQVSGGGVSGGTSAIPNNDSDFHIGTLNNGDGRNLTGDIAEIIIIRRFLTNAERIVVETYLASKYGISLANDFWDETTYVAYDNEIAGIGQHTDGSFAEAATSGILSVSGGSDRANGEWLFIGHDTGDITSWDNSFTEVPGTEERLSREWVVNETGDLGNVTVTIDGSGLPATGFSVPNYYLLVDSDGDADFSNATRYAMVSNGSGATVSVDLNEGDHMAIAFEGGAVSQIWYSYSSGNWNDPNTWTLDGAISPLYNNPSSEVPDGADTVVMQTGRIVTMDINDAIATRVEIIGTLDLAATTGATFGVLEGSGTLRLSGASGVENYPTVDDALFRDADGGGTVEYYGSGLTIDNSRSANNLLVNLGSAAVLTVLADMDVNGELTVSSGTFQFNDHIAVTSLNVDVLGDVLVEADGHIAVGTANARHEFNLYGDFTNQGDVNFTNLSAQSVSADATDGIVDVNFVSDSQDQEVDLQGPTDFYRIEVNKGVDDTYILDISATSAANFNLFGRANFGNGGAQETTNDNALGLIYGTVKVGDHVTISPLNAGGNYNIYEGAQIWVDGGTVEKTSGTAIVPYGTIRVSEGVLNAPINSGITVRDNGLLIIEGGTVTVNQFRTSINGVSAQGGLVMSGGQFNVIGGNTSGNYYIFSLTYEGNVFNISGGEINLSGVSAKGGIYINSSEENYHVTGGTVNVEVTNGNDFTITSKAPFFNLNVLETTASAASVLIADGSSGTGAGETSITMEKLEIVNDLRVDNSGGNTTTFDAGGIDLAITGSLIIDNGSSVDFSDMNLCFQGAGSSSIDVGLASTLVLDSLEINKNQELINLNITNGPATAIQIDEVLNVVSGNFNTNTFDVTVNGQIILADTIGTQSSTGQIVMSGAAAQSITSSTSGAIYDLEINNANGVSLSGNMGVINVLDLNAGIFDIGTSRLTTGAEVATTGSFGVALMIQTDGNASDGGLEYYFDGTTADPAAILFPIGTDANGTTRYTPATMDLSGIADDGFVAISLADAELQTTDQSGGNILSYYWRSNNRSFDSAPTVAYTFSYDASDDDASDEANFVPGKVLDGPPFTRSSELPANLNTGANVITFDNDGGGGFGMENANYTAGVAARFVGMPTLYYSRRHASNPNLRWETFDAGSGTYTNWSLTGHDGVAATSFPGAGDVVVIGAGIIADAGDADESDDTGFSNPLGRHQMVAQGSRSVAEIIFDSNPAGTAIGNNLSRIRLVNPAWVLTAGKISGLGELMLGINLTNEATVVADIGDFNEEENSTFFLDLVSAGTATFSSITDFPGIRIFGRNSAGKVLRFGGDITGRQILIDGMSNLEVASNITISDNVQIGNNNEGNITFPDDGENHRFSIGGDLVATSGDPNTITTENAGSAIHTLAVGGNITLEDINTFQLSSASGTQVNLELTGTGEHVLSNTAGVTVDMYRLLMNKGTDTTSTFTINTDITLSGDNTVEPQSIEFQNGKLILNHAALNLELADNSDLTIPASAGLEVTQGAVVATGSNMILDGLLRVNGGTATLGTTDIEYSTSGSALMDISAGTLNVGGQVRRSTSSTIGVLKYRQTGGDVDIATDGATNPSRGAFEILNTGSEFILTGGTFNIDRGVTGDANVSLVLDPATVDVTGSTITLFENLGADYGAGFFNISSAVALNNLTVANSIDLPDVRLFNQNLEVNDLTLNTNQVIITNGFNLTMNGNFTNEGTYSSTSSETIFAGSGAQTISGAGTFTIFDLRKSGTGTTTSSVSLDLGNDFFLTSGTFDVGSNTLSLQNDAFIQSTFINTGGNGLIFNGMNSQNLSGLSNNTVDIGTITISNPSGVDIPDGNGFNFNITQELRLNGGVFNIGGSLVTLKAGAPVTEVSTFNVNNMVQTNSSFTDNGLRIEFFTVAADTSIFFPVGELKYTPVQFDLDAATTNGSIRIRPANEPHPTIVDDTEPGTETEIDDTQNVLDYHWIVVAEDLTNASGSAVFHYDHNDINVTAPYDTTNYISARLLSNDVNWDKYAPTLFRGGGLNFEVPLSGFSAAEITGDYTAGVGSSDGVNNDIEGAIPDQLAQYETSFSGTGTYSVAANWNPLNGSPAVTDGVGPVGAQIIIRHGDELTIDLNDIRLYATEIEEGAMLRIPAGTSGLRLGTVTGSGTLVLEDNELLPTGEYSGFLTCDGGTLQYSGTTSYSILSGVSQIRKVVLEGSGTRIFPNNLLTICDTLAINGPTVVLNTGSTYTIGDSVEDVLNLQAGAVTVSNETAIDLNGSFEMDGGSFSGNPSSRINASGDIDFVGGTLDWNGIEVILDGTSEQSINGDFTSMAGFEDLTINNSSATGVTFSNGGNAMEVNGILTLTDGLVNLNSTADTLKLTSSGDWTGASAESYVTGKVTKQNIAVLSTYEFPVGKAARYAPVEVVNVETGGDDWTAEYFTSTGSSYPSSSFDSEDPGSGFNALIEVKSTDRWEISSAGSNRAQVRATYGSHNSYLDVSAIRLVWWDDAAAGVDGDAVENRWENQGGIVTGNATTGTVTSEASVFFSTRQFGLGAAPEVTLPVELLDFSAALTNQQVVLSWSTASEVNNHFFEVYHSKDGETFHSIGVVEGNGTTNEVMNYSLTHKTPAQGNNYYQLKQVDYDGTEAYFDILFLYNDAYQPTMQAIIYPNPGTSDNLNLRLSTGDANTPIAVKIIDMNGRLHYHKVLNGGSFTLDMKIVPETRMESGLYFMLVQQGDQIKKEKIFIR